MIFLILELKDKKRILYKTLYEINTLPLYNECNQSKLYRNSTESSQDGQTQMLILLMVRRLSIKLPISSPTLLSLYKNGFIPL